MSEVESTLELAEAAPPTLTEHAFAVSASILIFGGFNTLLSNTNFSTVEQSPSFTTQATLAGVYALGVFFGLRVPALYFGAVIRRPMLWIIPAFAVLSAAWSPDPALTLRRAVALGGTMTFSLFLVARFGPLGALRVLIVACSGAMLSSVMFAVFLPQYGVHQISDAVQSIHAGSWRGIFGHRTTLGQLSALTMTLVVLTGHSVIGGNVLRLLVLVASFICLVKAGSGGGYLSLVLLAVSIGLAQALAAVPGVARAATIAVAILVFSPLVIVLEDLVAFGLDVLGKDPTLTGRVQLWEFVLGQAAQSPWVGYGFSAGFLKLQPAIVATLSWRAAHPHNGYLAVLIDLGGIGLALCLILLISLFRSSLNFALASEHRGAGGLRYVPLVVAVFTAELNVVETALLVDNYFTVLLFSTCYAVVGYPLTSSLRIPARP